MFLVLVQCQDCRGWQKKSETYQYLRPVSSRIDGVHSTDTAMDLTAIYRIGIEMTTGQ